MITWFFGGWGMEVRLRGGRIEGGGEGMKREELQGREFWIGDI